jgi:Fic family protein
MDEEQVSDLGKKAPVGKLSEDEHANLNALRAYEIIDELSDEDGVPVDELVVRQLNREFLRGIAPSLEPPGRYRTGQNTVGIYTPPDQGDVPALMYEFAQWLTSADEIHPVLTAGISHIQFVAIHPFWNGNGRTARGLAALILQRSPFHFRKRLSLEDYMYGVRDTEYIPAIERTLGTQYTPGYDATPWLEFFVKAVDDDARRLQDGLTDWQRKIEGIYKKLELVDVNERQADALVFASLAGRITRSDYVEVAKISPATASRDLKWLVKKGWLIDKGKTRDRVYLWTEEARAEPPPPEQRRLFDDDQVETKGDVIPGK